MCASVDVSELVSMCVLVHIDASSHTLSRLGGTQSASSSEHFAW